MTEVVIMRGYPASGKTTVAQMDYPYHERISRDDLRQTMFGLIGKGVLPRTDEEKVTKAQEALVSANLVAGRPVVIDDTNLVARFARRWADVAEAHGVPFREHRVETPVDECVRWNGERHPDVQVPESVVRDYAKRFPWKNVKPITPSEQKNYPAFEKYEPNLNLPPAYVFDLDGTLADLSHRGPYDTDKYGDDGVHQSVFQVLLALDTVGYSVVYLTGRNEDYRSDTRAWIDANIGVPGPLYMRPSGDSRDDAIVKDELFTKYVAPWYRVDGVFDDRARVCRMWYAKGIPLFRVGDPDAEF